MKPNVYNVTETQNW